jgi:2-oxoisovalerate dehydrogenase E1 component alpha subunit
MDEVTSENRYHVPMPEDLVRLLHPDGQLSTSQSYPLDLQPSDYVSMYKHMRLARAFDGEAMNLARQGQLSVYGSLRGQEGCQVGIAYALRPEDWVFPSYREWAVALMRGISAPSLLRLSAGVWLSDYDPYEFHFGTHCTPVGTQVLHGAGFAMGAKFDGKEIGVVSFIGDGGTSEGDFHEALNFAGVFSAPLVVVIQNNQWAISVPVRRQTAAPTLAARGIGYGIPAVRIDGNDVLASHAVARWALGRARTGAGPTLIEAVTYRMGAHSSSDDPSRYEDLTLRAEWEPLDPIARFEVFLGAQGLLTEAVETEIKQQEAAIAQQLRSEIYEAPHGDPLELFDHVYVDPLPDLERQRNQLASELKRGGQE